MDRIKRTKELEAEDATAARKAVTAALWVSADGPNETETFLKALDEAGYVVARQGETSAWRRHDRIMDEEEKAEEAAATVARKAAAIPYSGSIKDCQAEVYSNDRAATFHQCYNRAVWVRRIREPDHHGRDGRIAVCTTHVKARQLTRYIGRAGFRREEYKSQPVEPEYQP